MDIFSAKGKTCLRHSAPLAVFTFYIHPYNSFYEKAFLFLVLVI